MNTILGRKVQQKQAFLQNGNRIPVTIVTVSDNPVIGVKTLDKDGYSAVKIGFGVVKKPTKPLLGEAKKANLSSVPQVMREIRGEEVFELGSSIKVEEVLQPGDIVDVTGLSKGKGFAGGVKRHQFKGGPRTHGQSDRERAPGSIGQTTTPGRVYKGKKMAGNMGNEKVTIKNLMVVDVNPGEKTVLIKGLVPGIFGGIISITKTGEVKEKNFSPLYKLETEKEEVITEVIEDIVVKSPEESQEEVSVETEVQETKAIEDKPQEEVNEAEPVQETQEVQATEEKPTEDLQPEENQEKKEEGEDK